MIQPVPSGARNGLPAPRDYTYRGKLPLAVELPYECEAGCGRRMEKTGRNGGVCAVCRGTSYYQDPKCEVCGYRRMSADHRVLCDGETDSRRRHRRKKL